MTDKELELLEDIGVGRVSDRKVHLNKRDKLKIIDYFTVGIGSNSEFNIKFERA